MNPNETNNNLNNNVEGNNQPAAVPPVQETPQAAPVTPANNVTPQVANTPPAEPAPGLQKASPDQAAANKNAKPPVMTNDALAIKSFLNSGKNKRTFIIIGFIVVAAVAAFFLLGGKLKKTFGGQKIDEETGKIIVETDTEWGNTFANYLQDLYGDKDVLAVTFLNLDVDATPEMVVKTVNKSNVEIVEFVDINNGEPTISKPFSKSSFKLVYSIEEKSVKMYLYLASTNKYGTYTQTSKLIDRTAMKPDILTSNEKELSTFNRRYIVSNFKPTYYDVHLDNYTDDFKATVKLYEQQNETVYKETNRMLEEYYDYTLSDNPNINEGDNLIVGDFTLEFGRYVTYVEVYDKGVVVGKEPIYMVLSKGGTLYSDDMKTTYKVIGKKMYLENGVDIDVYKNNEFVYGSSKKGRLTYKYVG